MPKPKNLQKQSFIALLQTYVFVIFICLTTFIVQYLLPTTFGNTEPFLLPLLSILISAYVGGFPTGVIATILSLVYVDYFFLPVFHSFIILYPQTIAQLVIFFLIGILISGFAELLRQTRSKQEYKRTIREQDAFILTLVTDLEKAKADIKSRDEFLSIASHELKTPLTSMLLQLQTVLYNIRNVSLANFSVQNLLTMLERAESQSKQIAKMINDLLNVSLITTGKIELDKVNGDIGEAVNGALDGMSDRFTQEGYVVHSQIASIPAAFDPMRMEQAIGNVLTNTIKYGDKKPIDVVVKREGQNAVIMISDHGIGISKEAQKIIFARFERSSDVKSYEGLGVGLYITQQIIEAHNGTISVKSREGAGSTFIIKLPIMRQQELDVGKDEALVGETVERLPSEALTERI